MNQHDYLVDPTKYTSFLPLENRTDANRHTGYYIPKVELEDYNVIFDERNLCDKPIINDLKTYDNFSKIAKGQGGLYTIVQQNILSCYIYFKKLYRLTAIDFSKQQKFNKDSDPKTK